MRTELCLTGTEAEMVAAQASIDKALGYPRKGQHIGSGIHCNMPDTWDGTGATPPGWTASATSVLSKDAATAVLPIGHLDPEAVALAAAALPKNEKDAVSVKLAAAAQVDVKDPAFVPVDGAKKAAVAASK